jgi:hypothetical protein
LALGFAAGYPLVGQTAAQLGLSVSALDVIYTSMISSMRQTAVIIAVLGVFIAVLGWVMGRSEPASRFRGAIRTMNSSARRRLGALGLDTGAFGEALARYRVAIRVVIAVLAVLWMYALRPLSFGDVVLVIFVAFAVAWILELLQKRPDEWAAPTASESAADAEAAAADAEAAAADAEATAAALQAWSASTTADTADAGAAPAAAATADAGAAPSPDGDGGAPASAPVKKPRARR